jgi:hypothetical protein
VKWIKEARILPIRRIPSGILPVYEDNVIFIPSLADVRSDSSNEDVVLIHI